MTHGTDSLGADGKKLRTGSRWYRNRVVDNPPVPHLEAMPLVSVAEAFQLESAGWSIWENFHEVADSGCHW